MTEYLKLNRENIPVPPPTQGVHMSATNRREQTAFTTTDLDLIGAFMALLSDFTRIESAPVRAYNKVLNERRADGNHVRPEQVDELTKIIDFETDKLMVSRLATNNRQVPLLCAADAKHITLNLFKGEPTSKQVAAAMALIEPMALISIKGNLIFLNAINSDPYTAFWQFVAALTNEAASSRSTLKRVVMSDESRKNVYRTCMPYQAWRRLTAERTAQMASISPSGLIGDLRDFMTDEEVVKLDGELASNDEKYGPQRAETVRRYEEFYTRLGQQIWPANARD